ncbi:hypothetical protein Hdeb2414_s0008g00282681 [Helianthus debilis subsp. tardiflorus]
MILLVTILMRSFDLVGAVEVSKDIYLNQGMHDLCFPYHKKGFHAFIKEGYKFSLHVEH